MSTRPAHVGWGGEIPPMACGAQPCERPWWGLATLVCTVVRGVRPWALRGHGLAQSHSEYRPHVSPDSAGPTQSGGCRTMPEDTRTLSHPSRPALERCPRCPRLGRRVCVAPGSRTHSSTGALGGLAAAAQTLTQIAASDRKLRQLCQDLHWRWSQTGPPSTPGPRCGHEEMPSAPCHPPHGV